MTMLTGKVAVVTGGAGGMGRAFAHRLARLGADVAILDIDLNVAARYDEKLAAASVMDEIRAMGRRSIGVEGDLADESHSLAAMAEIAAQLGRIDILINNAGGAVTPADRSAPSEMPLADSKKLFDANFFSMVNCSQAAIPYLRQQGGTIVNLASVSVDLTPASAKLAVYAATKAAILRFTHSLAVELGPQGIRVNCISPGIIETPRIIASAAQRKLGTPGQGAHYPLGRLGTSEDVAGVVEFLVSENAAYVTGENIRVCGGINLLSAG